MLASRPPLEVAPGPRTRIRPVGLHNPPPRRITCFRYTTALAAAPSAGPAAATLRRALHANRSLAALRGCGGGGGGGGGGGTAMAAAGGSDPHAAALAAEALADARVLVREHPAWAKGHYRAGQALLLLGRPEAAVAALAEAARQEPGACMRVPLPNG